ncbi:MAG: YitT family protein [Lachnospiraceae bacterium]|nr:YitT family protein [Lachnospiraceae bacterium]
MIQKIKNLIQKNWWALLWTTIGSLIVGLGIDVFYHHSKLISGGITGVAMILDYALGWNPSLTNIILNIPIFILGWILLGKGHVLISIYGTLVISLSLQLFSGLTLAYDSPLTTVVLGGAIVGFGSGITFRGGGTAGGTDIIGKILNKYFSVGLATTGLAFNVVVLIVFGFMFNLDLAILTLATSTVSSYVNNYINDGIDRRRALYIVTDKANEMALRIHKDLKRGATAIPCEGATLHQPKTMLYVVISRYQLAALKRLIKEVDPQAFFTIHVTTGVYGYGRSFHAVSEIQD